MPKIALIGAGSAVFSVNFIKDICLMPGLRESSIWLMDIDAERLEGVYTVCDRFARELGATLRIEKTTDRGAALAGADIVINTALAAGHARLRDGWEIARKHGYRFGGSLHIVHDEAFWINFYQLRMIESIQRDIFELCPDAWHVLVANPVQAAVTYLTRKYPGVRLVGMCHGFSGVYDLAQVLGLESEQLTFELPGVNHFLWLTRFDYKGEDAFPLIDRWIAEDAPAYWQTRGSSDHLGPKSVDLYRRFGAFPIGDTCTPGGGSWGYWYHDSPETERRWQEDPEAWYADHFSSGESTIARLRALREDRSKRVSDLFRATPSSEMTIPLVDSLLNGTEREIIVNIPNAGSLVPDVPTDYQVEVPARIDRRGIEGIPTDGLPTPITAFLLRDRIASVEMELSAFASGSKEALLQLIMMDPWTRSEAQAADFLRDLLAMPYHSEMVAHYR